MIICNFLAFSLTSVYSNTLVLNPFFQVSMSSFILPFFLALSSIWFWFSYFITILSLLSKSFSPFHTALLHALSQFRNDMGLVTGLLCFFPEKVQKATCVIKGHSSQLHSLVFKYSVYVINSSRSERLQLTELISLTIYLFFFFVNVFFHI